MADSRTFFFESCLGVFQGGGCRGAAFAGALEHVFSRGVNFSGLAGTSAGSIVAALLAAGATGPQITTTVTSLDFNSFLVDPDAIGNSLPFLNRAGLSLVDRFYPGAASTLEHQGRYSSKGIQRWLNAELKKLLPEVTAPTVKFSDLRTPVWVIATDLVRREVKIWSCDDTPDDDVAYAVRCSCTIPGFFQAVDRRYVDGGLLSNLPSFAFSKSGSNYTRRILAFTLASETDIPQPETVTQYFQAIVNTAIDGAAGLQARLVESVYELRIPTGAISSTDFSGMTPDKVALLANNGRKAAKDFLDNEFGKIKSTQSLRAAREGEDEILAELTTILNVKKVRAIYVSDDASRWLYSIFPAFLKWSSKGVRLHAWLPPNPQDKHEIYRRRLMVELGFTIHITDTLAFRGFLIDPDDDINSCAIVYAEETVSDAVRAIRYSGPDDQPAIRALFSQLIFSPDAPILVPPRLERGSDTDLIDKLRAHVPQYQQATMQMQTLPIARLVALSKLVREYKYQQVKALHSMFQEAGLDPFDVSSVRYASGKQTIVTPPVVEASGDEFYLIQGTTRAVYCNQQGIENLRCLVVRNPSAPLPSQNKTPIRDVLVGARTLSTVDRYGQKIDADFRRIEYAVHYPSETLI